MKILLLEDEPQLSKEIVKFLAGKGIECNTVFDGQLFFMENSKQSYDMYLLDINVPRINGLEVCKRIRESDNFTPIIMLTAYGEISDKSEAFNLGADDYMVKPFHFDELLLRIQSLSRRSNKPISETKYIRIADLEINTTDKEITRGGQNIELTPKEFKLLTLLALARGRTLSKNQIASEIWDEHIDTSLNTIEVYINFLRKKVDKGHTIKLIHTRPGFGYCLKVDTHDS